ncbi:MAG: Fe-S cluster assembly sulfur transfer protein SufU [Oligoflexales bacterium]
MSNQLDLYQQVILEHNRKPRNFHSLDQASHQAEGYNPLCGDHLWVYLKVDDNEKIIDISFKGNGCAISKASASMMTSSLKGKNISDARKLFTQFQKLLKGELNPATDSHDLGKLKIFSSIWQYPSRIKCAGLAWHAMNGALEQKIKSITTE